MTRSFPLLFVLAGLLAACAQPPASAPQAPEPTVTDSHTAENALDLTGDYTGTMPCADCPGIATTVTLEPQGAARLSRVYLERNDGRAFSSTGRWTVHDNRVMLTMEDGEILFFHTGENTLTALDIEGHEITGPIAAHMVLRKNRTPS